jgi:rubrerythrin
MPNASDANPGAVGPVSNGGSKELDVGDTTIHALDLLREHEKAIGRLYDAYARRFAADREFWLGLSREEEQHANWVRSLQSKVEEDPSSLVVKRFPTEAIELSLAYVNRLIEGVGASGPTRVNALSAALDLERGLLEHRYFEVFSSGNPQIRRTLQLLQQSTQTHLQKVQHLWEACTQVAAR